MKKVRRLDVFSLCWRTHYVSPDVKSKTFPISVDALRIDHQFIVDELKSRIEKGNPDLTYELACGSSAHTDAFCFPKSMNTVHSAFPDLASENLINNEVLRIPEFGFVSQKKMQAILEKYYKQITLKRKPKLESVEALNSHFENMKTNDTSWNKTLFLLAFWTHFGSLHVCIVRPSQHKIATSDGDVFEYNNDKLLLDPIFKKKLNFKYFKYAKQIHIQEKQTKSNKRAKII